MLALEAFVRAAQERFGAKLFRAVVSETADGRLRLSLMAVGHEHVARWSGTISGDRVIQDDSYDE